MPISLVKKPTASAQQQAKFSQGLWLHQQGRFAEAERMYREVLQREPLNAAALHMFGMLTMQTGRLDRAVKLIGRAIALDPNDADAHNSLGVALQEQKRLNEAVSRFDRAIGLRPGEAELHSNRGRALEALGRPQEALASYDKAIELKPDFADAHNSRGNVLCSLHRPEEALAAYDRAIALQPGLAAAHHNRGNALRDLEHLPEALDSYAKAIALRPDYAEAHANRGAVLLQLHRAEEAVASCDKAIALQPGLVAAHHNRGNALRELQRYEDALASLNRALALAPGYVQVLSDRGTVLNLLRRTDEALASFSKATELAPEFAEAWAAHAICLLQMGRLAEGWPLYEWRKKQGHHRSYPQPLWSGDQDLFGKTLFIHWEQGLGDTLCFCRYARLAEGLGARVVLEVQRPLVGLLAQLSPTIQVIGPDQPPPDFDYHCPLLSLPLAFGTELGTIPSAQPYLRTDDALRARWLARLPEKRGRRIGVAWSGNPGYLADASRSIDLATFQSLFDLDAEWICLQMEARSSDRTMLEHLPQVAWFGEELGDFASTAALFDLMDLVITVDTSVGHLAAAMGKPVWLLLSHNADWRWMWDRADSPWYPTVRLFRERRGDGWTGVLDEVRRELLANSSAHAAAT